MQYANDYSRYGNAVLYLICSEKSLHTDIVIDFNENLEKVT